MRSTQSGAGVALAAWLWGPVRGVAGTPWLWLRGVAKAPWLWLGVACDAVVAGGLAWPADWEGDLWVGLVKGMAWPSD